MYDVVVFGSCNIDFISYVERMPKPRETIHSISYETGFGGKGANQCIAAARLGCKTAMIAKLGNDPNGEKYKSYLESEGINVEFVEHVGDHSGVALIVVSSDGENQIVINNNANNFLGEDDCVKASSLMDQSQILICQLETPLDGTIVALKTFKGVSILNAAPALKLPDDIFQLPNIFCVNELESEELTGVKIEDISNVRASIENLKKKGCQKVIITLGKLGAAFNENSGQIIHIPLPKEVKVVDTVGAGDAFIGALGFFISKYPESSWIQRIGASIEIASHSVQYKGTQKSFINFPQINPFTKTYAYNQLS